MKQRCFNTKAQAYKLYGGRGITVCDRWLDFINFYNDMLPGWKKGLHLDRIDNDGNYEPKNCRWTSQKENNRNSRNCKYVTFNGETKCLGEWCEITGIKKERCRRRRQAGWPMLEALGLVPRHSASVNRDINGTAQMSVTD